MPEAANEARTRYLEAVKRLVPILTKMGYCPHGCEVNGQQLSLTLAIIDVLFSGGTAEEFLDESKY